MLNHLYLPVMFHHSQNFREVSKLSKILDQLTHKGRHGGEFLENSSMFNQTNYTT